MCQEEKYKICSFSLMFNMISEDLGRYSAYTGKQLTIHAGKLSMADSRV